MAFFNNSIFWVEVEKVFPNPFQPRKEFDEARLKDLAESIRQYGILQPLVVSRKEKIKEDGGLFVEYELISGERRLRASRLAGLSQVPVLIRSEEDSDKMKLELAIIENLQREDLNPVDRARAFDRLAKEFNLKHHEIAQKIGKSRMYVSNTLRLLSLPEEVISVLTEGKISEGHARTLLMLSDRPEEQNVLFKEIMLKRLTVRETENIARRIAVERQRKPDPLEPEYIDIEGKLAESLGTKVRIDKRQEGGRIVIDFASPADLRSILEAIEKKTQMAKITPASAPVTSEPVAVDDRSEVEKEAEENDELYSVKNFSI
ncbi:MAG: ParB/RepB/Spo0J family partition protein [Candidatus Paceibacterota bacterium]